MRDRQAHVELDVNPGRDGGAARERREVPFRIAFLGDFSGRASRGIVESGDALVNRRRIVRIDGDTVDDALARIPAELRLSLENEPELALRFGEIDDFHPDRLVDRLPAVAAARAMPPSPEPAPERPPVAAGGLLDQIVGAPLPAPERAPRADEGDDLHAFIQRAVAPHLVRAPSAEESAARARSDATVDARLRRLLHHPGFQALEASWRAVDFLLRRIGDAPVQLWLVDLSRAELERDLAPGRAVEESALFTLLARPQLEGGDTWTLVVADYAFGPSLDDAALLSRIANVARVAGAPWLAAADTDAWGEEDATHPAWEALRRTPDAPMLGLVLPRLLMRLPYGRDGEPCERSTFEEMEDGQVQHESLLWGNGAVAAAALLAESFDADGWAMRPGTHRVLDALPFHVRRVDGAAVATPCVELALSERQAARIAERGLMPLAWMKDSDAAQLVRFHSVASPEAALAGRWTELDS